MLPAYFFASKLINYYCFPESNSLYFSEIAIDNQAERHRSLMTFGV